MYYDLTWDHGKMRYKCALPKILKFVTSLSFNEFESIRISYHGPKRITKNERKSKQIPDNKALSGIPFIWQVAENSCFKHIRRSSHINLWNQSKENSKGKDHTAVLKIEEGCAQNSAITRLKNLKKIIRIALENDWIKKDPFAYYRFKLEETDPEFLTMDEINIILA